MPALRPRPAVQSGTFYFSLYTYAFFAVRLCVFRSPACANAFGCSLHLTAPQLLDSCS